MKLKWKTLFISILIPLATGALSAFLTKKGMTIFQSTVKQPPLSPPSWLFPIVWTLLYLLMGIASYLVYTSDCKCKAALSTYAIQLIFNFLWSIVFFHLQWYRFAFVWLLILWLFILLTAKLFSQCSKTAGYLLIPYLIWVAFAGYLNLGVSILNR